MGYDVSRSTLLCHYSLANWEGLIQNRFLKMWILNIDPGVSTRSIVLYASEITKNLNLHSPMAILTLCGVITWTPPLVGGAKLNTDGCVNADLQQSGRTFWRSLWPSGSRLGSCLQVKSSADI